MGVSKTKCQHRFHIFIKWNTNTEPEAEANKVVM